LPYKQDVGGSIPSAPNQTLINHSDEVRMIPTTIDDIPIQVKRTRRRKTAEFSLRDGGVRLLVPDRLSDAEICRLIERRSGWIRKKIQEQEAAPRLAPKEYVSGESFTYLGRNYRLKIVEGSEKSVKLIGGRFVVSIPHNQRVDPDLVAELLKQWYIVHAEERLREKVERYGRTMNVSPASIAVKDYRSRWGSCTHTRSIGFSWRIIIAPHRIVDYLVVHELAHLIHHDHSPAFWEVVRRFIPDYKERRKWLRDNEGVLVT
jgi:predicted metal-dependent hydrolase